MRILLVSLNAKYVHRTPAPYALAAGVKQYAKGDHEIKILDLTVNEPWETLVSAVTAEEAELYGFCCYIWNIALISRLLPSLRAAHPGARILLGGPEVSYRVESAFSELPEADLVLSGEGEWPFAALADAVAVGAPLSSVAGLSYRTVDGIHFGIPYVTELTPPSPLSAGYAEAVEGRIGYLETSRGCPFRCAFCLSGRVGSVRYFPMERVKEDILRLVSARPRMVKFVDRTFNADRRRAREIFAFLMKCYGREIPREMSFHFEMSADLLDEETLSLLAQAPRGLFRMELGLQSFHPETLAAIHRAPTVERTVEGIRRLLALGNITVHIDLIAGLPLEDFASFRAGCSTALRLGAHMLQLGFLKMLYGAPLREEGVYPCRYTQAPPYEVTATPALTEEEMARIHLAEMGCDRVYNSGRYRRTVAHLFQAVASPYDLMEAAGAALSRLAVGAPLREEVACLYTLFSRYTDASLLRDLMLLDHLTTNSSRDIPPVLRRPDPTYAQRKQARTAGERGRVGFAILYARGEEAVVRYDTRDPITGEYPVTLFPIEKHAGP